MTSPPDHHTWPVQDRFLEMRSHWLTLIGEHLLDTQGQSLEYWRIEKADSAIVLPIQTDRILLPFPSYRPGIGQVTLDFPGGRVAEGQSPAQAAIATLQRELGIEATAIAQLTPLNQEGWPVNSSFSNQRLHGFVAQIKPEISLQTEYVAATYAIDRAGIQQLLQELNCLQCRLVLFEWQLSRME